MALRWPPSECSGRRPTIHYERSDLSVGSVGVIGCGKVGGEYLAWLHEQGHVVFGYDVASAPRAKMSAIVGADRVVDRIDDLAGCVSLHICVPTRAGRSWRRGSLDPRGRCGIAASLGVRRRSAPGRQPTFYLPSWDC